MIENLRRHWLATSSVALIAIVTVAGLIQPAVWCGSRAGTGGG